MKFYDGGIIVFILMSLFLYTMTGGGDKMNGVEQESAYSQPIINE